jgi:acyl transferase domain-containing protein
MGLLVLERESEARRRGHRVLAVVRGSAVNQDGASNGLTAPSGPSQRRVIERALAAAGLRGEEVDAVEGHGTGTRLGDPIEVGALMEAYGGGREEPLWLGSVKSNIGHTQGAAGVAGVIKVVMAMGAGVLPRTLHVDEPTPQVEWGAGRVEVLREARAWPERGGGRRAGVSSFGVSGTNAHVVLERSAAADRREPAAAAVRGVVPWVVTGRTEGALRAQAARLRERVEAEDGLEPAAVGSALAGTRAVFERRAVVLGEGREQLLAGLAALAAGDEGAEAVVRAEAVPGRVALVFPGGAFPWQDAAADLGGRFPAFAVALADVREEAGPPGRDSPLAFQVALHRLLRAWGVRADRVAGQGPGALAAACATGELSVHDAAARLAGPDAAGTAPSLDGARVVLLLGPDDGALRAAAPGVTVVPALTETAGAVRSLLTALARLFTGGLDVDWSAILAGVSPRLVELPTYAFQRTRYWLDARPPAAAGDSGAGSGRVWGRITAPDPRRQ